MAEGFLSELAADERAELEALGSVRRYRRGDVLFHQGDDAGAVLVLLEGHVKAAMLNDGREVILAFPGPGELLGELSAVDGEPRSGTVRAVDDVEALVIPGRAFRAFLAHHPPLPPALPPSVTPRGSRSYCGARSPRACAPPIASAWTTPSTTSSCASRGGSSSCATGSAS